MEGGGGSEGGVGGKEGAGGGGSEGSADGAAEAGDASMVDQGHMVVRRRSIFGGRFEYVQCTLVQKTRKKAGAKKKETKKKVTTTTNALTQYSMYRRLKPHTQNIQKLYNLNTIT